jgi:hypothetical protein
MLLRVSDERGLDDVEAKAHGGSRASSQRYGPAFSAEGFEIDVDTKASEVSVRALDASVVFGSASVVIGPQRGAAVRQRCHARALRNATISRARLPDPA